MYGGTIYNAKVIATKEDLAYLSTELGGTYRNINGDGGVGEACAQSIDIGAYGGKIKQLNVSLRKYGSPTGNLTCEVATSIGGAAIANGTSNTIAASSTSTDGGWYEFVFATAPILSASTTYYFHFYTSSSYDYPDRVVVVRSDGSTVAGVGSYTKDNGSWGSESVDDLSLKLVLSNGEPITKLQTEYLLINEAQADTGLQEYPTSWNPAEWNDGEGGLPDMFHEHSADDPGSNTKLQDEDTSDLPNSDITGDDLTRGGTKLTMPGSAKEIDSYIVTA
jgi:hypothetical protein